MAIQIDRRSSNIEYDANGIAVSELLPGSYDGGIRNYRYNLKPEVSTAQSCMEIKP